jgi:uncharacterized iron-regulated membrane protein
MMRKLFQKLHLWLGFVSGLLVFVIAFTGALYAFREEISSLNGYQKVERQEKDFLFPTELRTIAERALPEKELQALKYCGKSKAAEAIFYGYNPTYYYTVYLNPYTGEVLKIKNMEHDFFRFVMQGHFYLWLPPRIGQPLVAGSTLVFLIVLITGLVVWIPKNRKALRNRIWFRWKKGTRWPRINLDLHVVGGLYATVFALIFSITGLVWGFQWFANGWYNLLGGEKSLTYNDTSPHKMQQPTDRGAMDKVWSYMQKTYPEAAFIEIHPPRSDSSLIAATATRKNGKYWSTDYRYFDQYHLKEVKTNTIFGQNKDMNAGEKLFRMNYEIHTGAILGLPGKIFAFLMSLFIASLPITGYIIWWKKRR